MPTGGRVQHSLRVSGIMADMKRRDFLFTALSSAGLLGAANEGQDLARVLGQAIQATIQRISVRMQ